MIWIDLLTASIFAVMLFAHHLWGYWRGRRDARNAIIDRAYAFAGQESDRCGRFSPTLTRFIRSLEREEHRK